MFNDTYLIEHLDTQQAIKVEAGCFVELNQNDLENVDTIGVYKYGDYSESQIRQWTGNPNQYWVHKDVVTDLQNNDLDLNDYMYFGTRRKADYFSLPDCFTEFRPRSGINKLVQPMAEKRTYIDDFLSVRRPRYYPCSVDDRFKYWTSWNTDIGPDVGVSGPTGAIKYAAPFIVYKKAVAANRITVKIQTGIGESVNTLGTRIGVTDPLNDPLLSTIPRKWKIQYLDVFNTWQNAMVFPDWNKTVLKPEFGHLDIVYMVRNPSPSLWPYFVLKGYIPSTQHLPIRAYDGEAFCVGRDSTHLGKLYVWSMGAWLNTGDIDFQWRIADPTMNPEEYAVKDFVDPVVYNPTIPPFQREGGDAYDQYAGFVFMRGLRILVDTMVARDKPFELIELSPRLFANVSDRVIDYSVDKALSDTNSVLPVGGLSVASGDVSLSNHDLAFNREMEYDTVKRTGSIVAGRVRNNTKFLFYEIIREVNVNGVLYDKFVPVKNLYVVGRPVTINGDSDVDITLRDFNFRFEEQMCPNLMLKDCSLTKAVAVLLDSIGFTNYIFHVGERNTWKSNTSPLDTVFPYLFTNETQSIASVLDQLSIASQCAMFFDEYNNLVVMPREHFAKEAEYILRGGKVTESNQILYPNIQDIEISTNAISDAEITFTHRDLARGNLPTTYVTDSGTRDPGEFGNTMGYKPTDVWNITKLDRTTLSAAPLNTTLTVAKPVFDPKETGGIANITFDLGVYAQYYPYQGLTYMDGEIIEFDAKEYTIGGKLVWVESDIHLNELVGRSSFSMADGSGQMVYPTGRMRIKTELHLDSNNNLTITNHGRGMFGTTITSHTSEPTEWLNSTTYKFTDTALQSLYGNVSYDNWTFGKYNDAAGHAKISNHYAASNYIYNSLYSRNAIMNGSPMTINPADVSKPDFARRIMRSSALTFRGDPAATPNDVYMKTKRIEGAHYNLFGARIGIIGTQFAQNDGDNSQLASGASVLGTYTLDGESMNVEGAGGGLVFYSNRNTTAGSLGSNDGYYFEIMALSSSYTIEENDTVKEVVFANVNFYKINRGVWKGGGKPTENVAVKLFSTYANILVTSGSQTVRDRTVPSDLTSVYDLSVLAYDIGTINNYQKVFYLYINDVLVGVVEEPASGQGYFVEKSKTHTELGIFARGASVIQVEHLYAVGTQSPDPDPIFIDQKVMSRPRAFKVFSPSAIYAAASLDGGPSPNSIYFEEFGAIAREVRSIEAKFELNPIAISTIAKRPIFDRTYSTTSYFADPYVGHFMLWSQADRLMDLGVEETALSILGLPLQNNEPVVLTVDDFLAGNYDGANRTISYDIDNKKRRELVAIRASGDTDVIKLESQYIQDRDYATNLMRWLTGFMGVERTELDIMAFGIPHIQLGDIVKVDYNIPYYNEKSVPANPNPITPVDPAFVQKSLKFVDGSKSFMVQSININRSGDGPDYKLHLIELPDAAHWRSGTF